MKAIIIYGVACALEYLHSGGFIHGFLKPSNVLLTNSFEPIVTDYFITSLITPDPSIPISTSTYDTSAPELFSYKGYDKRVDVYAFAMFTYQLLLELSPYPELDHTFPRHTHEYPTFPPNILHPKLEALLNSCWSKNPHLRPTMTEVIDQLNILPSFFNSEMDHPEVYSKYKETLSKLRPTQSIEWTPMDRMESLLELTSIGDPESMYQLAMVIDDGIKIQHDEKRIKKLLKQAADKGHIQAQFEYAERIRQTDAETAVKYYDLATKSDDPQLLLQIAERYLSDHFITPDFEKAVKYLRVAAEKGDPLAQYRFGQIVVTGLGIKRDLVEGVKFINKAADQGHIEAMLITSDLLHTQPNRIQDSLEYLIKAAREGSDAAALRLAEHYSDDPEKQGQYLKLAADLGNTSAMNLYAQTLLKKQDLSGAEYYFKLLAEQGDSDACIHYGQIQQKKDEYVTAAKYFEKAANAGNVQGMYEFATLLISFSETSRAMKHMKHAADLGHHEAQCQYGILLMEQSAKDNWAEAARYLQKAVDAGLPLAQYKLGVILTTASEKSHNPNLAAQGFELIKKAYESKAIPEVAIYYSRCLMYGTGCERNSDLGMKVAKEAADNGDIQSAYMYAYFQEDEDFAEFMKYMKVAADAGVGEAMYKLGKTYYYGTPDFAPNPEEALAWLKKGAKVNNQNAIHMLKIISTK